MRSSFLVLAAGHGSKKILDITKYTDRIISHAGEDDKSEWSDPLGPEAQRVLDEFVAILKGGDKQCCPRKS